MDIPQLCAAAVFAQQSSSRIKDAQDENTHISDQEDRDAAGTLVRAVLPGCGERTGLPAGLTAGRQMGFFTPPFVYSNTLLFSGPLCFAANKEHQSLLRDYPEMQLGTGTPVAQ